MNLDLLYINESRQWIDNFIIRHSICPFAHKVVSADQVDYHVSHLNAEDLDKLLIEIVSYVSALTVSTGFVIYPNQFPKFLDFLDYYYACEMFLEESEFDDDFQIVAFHPQYLFGGEDPTDASHSTNRSPFPMIHILRKDEVEEAILHFGDTRIITRRNIELLRKMKGK